MRFVAVLSLMLLAPPSRADEGAAFLKIGVGAGAGATGGAQTALARDSSAIYWNPAGLAGSAGGEVAAHHTELFADTRFDYLAFSRTSRIGTIGAGFGYLSQGSIEGRDENRAPTGTFTASDVVASVALARRFARVRLGAAIKGVQSRIADAHAQTAAVDLGATFDVGPRLSFGLAALNVGPGMRFLDVRSSLPLTLAAGASWAAPFGLRLAADGRVRPYSNAKEFGVGTEYQAVRAITIRAGWQGVRVVGNQSARERAYLPQGFAAGLGISVSSYRLDYSFTPFGELGNVQRLSLSSRFK